MNLLDIKEPSDIKGCTKEELDQLANDIRAFLIESISKTGGHLASNLGVVELTIALHYVFDSPKDKIFFDVGHQSYVHKILTGRANQFSSLRQYNGLSGFEKRKESIHDVWEAGHSSTALSGALGMAIARDLNNEDYNIIPVVGDGAMASGMSLEALNQIGSLKSNVIIVFNDNNMSISKNVGALNTGFSRLRASKAYTGIKSGMRKSLLSSDVGNQVYVGLRNLKETVKGVVIDGGIFEELNIDYIGPIDGHNLNDLIRVFNVVKTHTGPIVVHVHTKKGKGYAPCENDSEGVWHGVGPFDITSGRPLKDIPANYKPWAQHISDTLIQLASTNKDIVAITPAMITGSSLQKFFAKYPDRSFDCGIAEEHAATFAAGLAISGKKPFLCIYSSFLQRAYDQINHDICRMDLPVVIGIDHAGLVGEDGETHHGVFDLGILLPLPNLIIAQPKNSLEAKNLLYTAFNQDHPFAIRYPKGMSSVIEGEFENLPIGKWETVYEPENVECYILTYGDNVEAVEECVLSNQFPIGIINCRYLKPIDTDMLDYLASKDLPMLVYEQDMLVGGLSNTILSYYNDKNISIYLRRIGIPDIYIGQGSTRQLRKDLKMDIHSVIQEALAMCKK